MHLEVSGLENLKEIPRGRSVIFASNHSGEIDPFITPASLPFMSRFIPLYYTIRDRSFYDKSGIRQMIYGGFLFKFIGGQYVYPGLKDYEKSLPHHLELLRENRNLFIFPEGGISKTGAPGEAKGGVAFLAERSNSPIVPVGVKGVYGMSISDFLMRRRRIQVAFGAPIYQEKLKSAVDRGDAGDMSVYKREARFVMNEIGRLIVG